MTDIQIEVIFRNVVAVGESLLLGKVKAQQVLNIQIVIPYGTRPSCKPRCLAKRASHPDQQTRSHSNAIVKVCTILIVVIIGIGNIIIGFDESRKMRRQGLANL